MLHTVFRFAGSIGCCCSIPTATSSWARIPDRLGALYRETICERILLNGLDAAEVAQLIADSGVPAERRDAVVDAINTATNPARLAILPKACARGSPIKFVALSTGSAPCTRSSAAISPTRSAPALCAPPAPSNRWRGASDDFHRSRPGDSNCDRVAARGARELEKVVQQGRDDAPRDPRHVRQERDSPRRASSALGVRCASSGPVSPTQVR